MDLKWLEPPIILGDPTDEKILALWKAGIATRRAQKPVISSGSQLLIRVISPQLPHVQGQL